MMPKNKGAITEILEERRNVFSNSSRSNGSISMLTIQRLVESHLHKNTILNFDSLLLVYCVTEF